jgi:hypothetical protein
VPTARHGGRRRLACGAEAMVAYLKLLIAKMKRERFGRSAERSHKLLDQLELQLEELEGKHPATAVMGDRQAAVAGISRSFQFQGSSSCSREAG